MFPEAPGFGGVHKSWILQVCLMCLIRDAHGFPKLALDMNQHSHIQYLFQSYLNFGTATARATSFDTDTCSVLRGFAVLAGAARLWR